MSQTTFAEDRLIELEVRLTHLEASLEHLTDYQLQQERQLKALHEQLDLLKTLLKEAAPAAVVPQEFETPPPHY